jgi:hypothetical protein
VKDDNGVWWFQGPDGSRFYSLGVNNIEPEPFMPRPGSDYYNPVPTEFKGDTNMIAALLSKTSRRSELSLNSLANASIDDKSSRSSFITRTLA